MNIITLASGFKSGYWRQYPLTANTVYTYCTYNNLPKNVNNITFFGLQYFLAKYLAGRVVDEGKIAEAKALGIDVNNWQYILDIHHGKLPIKIMAIPEGSSIAPNNILFSIENIDPKCYWLPHYLQEILGRVWYSCIAATVIRDIKIAILNELDKSGDPESIDARLYDFGAYESDETAILTGMAHLVNFKSTYNVTSVKAIKDYYGYSEMAYHFPYTSKNLMAAWTNETQGCLETFNFYNDSPAMIDCDSINFDHFLSEVWCKHLKGNVNSHLGTLILKTHTDRPNTVVGKAFNHLKRAFGASINEKGYINLTSKIKLLVSGSLSLENLATMYHLMNSGKWSADNLYLGFTSLPNVVANSFNFNFRNACNRLKLIFKDGMFKTVPEQTEGEECLREVFNSGELTYRQNFEEIRERAFLD